MFETVSPESAGVSSRDVERFLRYLDDRGLATHSVMLLRGDKVFCQAYWKPFTGDSFHRMYSETKSFVGIAVSQLIAQGKIGLTDRIVTYFQDKLPDTVPEELQEQTVEDMLTMKTCFSGGFWFREKVTDRVAYYFHRTPSKRPGTAFAYDSDGSFVLGALVERVTGKKLLDYLREICLNEIGFSADAEMLSCVGGYSWGDSGLICKTEDICRFARLLANRGEWGGRQLLDADMVDKATGFHADTSSEKHPYETAGYGYQIWKNPAGSFSFQGMHGQYMHYDPATDILFACTSGNRSGEAGHLIYEGLRTFVLETAREKLPENEEETLSLKRVIDGLSLLSLGGKAFSDQEETLGGKTFRFSENPMGIEWMRFGFSRDAVCLEYENKQGEKKILCGRNQNRIQKFPQFGYSGEIGGEPSPGNAYDCAAAAAWASGDELLVKIQIIDRYIGILDMRFAFSGNTVCVTMTKEAENFLEEYNGKATGSF